MSYFHNPVLSFVSIIEIPYHGGHPGGSRTSGYAAGGELSFGHRTKQQVSLTMPPAFLPCTLALLIFWDARVSSGEQNLLIEVNHARVRE